MLQQKAGPAAKTEVAAGSVRKIRPSCAPHQTNAVAAPITAAKRIALARTVSTLVAAPAYARSPLQILPRQHACFVNPDSTTTTAAH